MAEPTPIEHALAARMDNKLAQIEEDAETLEEHSQLNQTCLAEQVAAYREELLADPGHVLAAAEKLLREAGINTVSLGHVAIVANGANGLCFTRKTLLEAYQEVVQRQKGDFHA